MAVPSSSPRLLFLYPMLFQPAPVRRIPVSVAQHLRSSKHHTRRARFSTSAIRHQAGTSSGPSQQRYGTANEPPPQFSSGKKGQTKNGPKEKNEAQQAKAQPATEHSEPQQQQAQVQQQDPQQQQKQPQQQPKRTVEDGTEAAHQQAEKEKVEQKAKETVMGSALEQKTRGTKVDEGSTTNTADEPPSGSLSQDTPYQKQSALQTILAMEPPVSPQDDANVQEVRDEIHQAQDPEGMLRSKKPPHLEPPRYVHHFDTYTLVRDLQRDGGFSEQSAINLMKIMRILLTRNMDLARDGLVSKGDAEMESYLFRAAASELRTEIRNVRSRSIDQQRSERTGLQHEADILSQRITADTAALKDELKGMMDDRKMAVRMERREVENQVQELNYEITTLLNSEMKSEVEGLRWVLVRRTAIALVAVAGMTLAALRYSAHVETKNQAEKQKELDRRKTELDKESAGGSQPSLG